MATKVGTGYVDILGNFAPLRKGLAKEAPALRTRLAAIGKVGALGLAAVGAASVKASIDFQHSMNLISTQAGGSRKEVNKLSDQVVDLARKSIFGPKELADALFHVESAGFHGAKAMKVLNASQKLATVGQSDLEDTTYALVSAQESGIKGTGKLRDTIGSLNAIVGHGDQRMQDLTASLQSGVLVTAKQVGINLNEVGAALDTMTVKGIPAQAAATSLNQGLLRMATPTTAAAEALKSIGIGANDMAKTFREKGLVAGVQLLADHLDKVSKTQANAVLTQAFGVRSARAVRVMVGDVGDLRERLSGITKDAGNFNEKLKEAKMDPENQLRRAGAQIQAMLVTIGGKLAPMVTQALTDVTAVLTDPKLSVSEKFSKLANMIGNAIADIAPKALKAGAVLGVAVARGIVGAFIHANILGKAAIATALIALFGGKAAFIAIGRTMANLVVDSMITTTAGARLYLAAQNLSGGLAGAMGKAIPVAIAAVGIVDLINTAVKGDAKQSAFKGAGLAIGGALGAAIGGPLGALVGAGIGEQVGGLISGLFGDSKKLTTMQERLRSSSKAVKEALQGQKHAAQDLGSSSKAVERAHHREQASSKNAEKAQRAYTRAVKQYGPESRQAIEKARDLARAKEREKRASQDARRAEKLHGDALKLYRVRTREAVQATQNRIRVDTDHIKALKNHIHQEHQEGQTWAMLRPELERLVGAENDRRQMTDKVNRLIQEASAKVNPKFAHSLKNIRDNVVTMGSVFGRAQGSVKDINRRFAQGQQDAHRFGLKVSDVTGVTRHFGQNTMPQAAQSTSRGLGKMGGAFQNWSGVVYSGSRTNVHNVGAIAKGFQADFPTIHLQKPKGGKQGRQRGGSMFPGAQLGMDIPGQGVGDKVFVGAWTEPGEKAFILNKNASEQLRALEWWNSQFPRFLRGGVNFGGHPSNVEPQVRNFIATMQSHFPLAVTATTDGSHVSGSYHYKGQAVDLSAGTEVMYKASDWIKKSGTYRSLQEGIHNPNLSVNAGQMVPSSYYASVWADHADHIHAALTGKFGPVVQQLARLLVTGKGPLQTTAQGGLDLERDAMNKWMSKHLMPAQAPASSGAFGKSALMQLWRATGSGGDANLMAAIALAESGGDPRADNGIARGLWQIIQSTWSAYGKGSWDNAFNAQMNAQAAHRILAGGGLGQWETYTNGAYRQYLQSGGLIDPFPRLKDGGSPDSGGEVGPGGPGGRGGMDIEKFLRSFGLIGFGRLHDVPGDIHLIKRLNHIGVRAAMGRPTRDQVHGGVDAIKKIALPGKLTANLAASRLTADTAAQKAEFASSLNTDSDTGTVYGTVGGHDELYWLGQQLISLFSLRNFLINAKEGLEARIKYTDKLKKLIEKLHTRIKHIMGHLDKLKKRYQKHIDDITKKIGELRDQLGKTKDSSTRQRLRDRIHQLQDAKDKTQESLDNLNEFAFPAGRAESGAINAWTEPISSKRTNLKDALSQRLEDLNSLQGIQVGYAKKKGVSWTIKNGAINFVPSIGTYFGEIGDVELQMRQIVTDAATASGSGGGTTEDNSQLVDALKAQVLDLQQQLIVSSVSAPLRSDLESYLAGGGSSGTYAGVFHEGGRLPGPIGQERTYTGLAGETVLPIGAEPGGTAVIIQDGAVNENRIKILSRGETARSLSRYRRSTGRMVRA